MNTVTLKFIEFIDFYHIWMGLLLSIIILSTAWEWNGGFLMGIFLFGMSYILHMSVPYKETIHIISKNMAVESVQNTDAETPAYKCDAGILYRDPGMFAHYKPVIGLDQRQVVCLAGKNNANDHD